MTTVTVVRSEGNPIALVAEGHSGFAERGADVVCASVSSLVQALALGVTEILALEGASAECDAEDEYMEICWPRECWPQVALLAETVFESLRRIAAQYPENVCVSEVYDENHV